MPPAEIEQLIAEHRALMRHCGEAQVRCSEHIWAQAREIERLHAERTRLRAMVVVRDTALAWAREDGATAPLDAALPGHRSRDDGADLVALEASLVAADLVICQTGCLSHGAYWRVRDHCKRTGKACVLVERPDALRIVRIKTAGGDGTADAAAIHEGTLP